MIKSATVILFLALSATLPYIKPYIRTTFLFGVELFQNLVDFIERNPKTFLFVNLTALLLVSLYAFDRRLSRERQMANTLKNIYILLAMMLLSLVYLENNSTPWDFKLDFKTNQVYASSFCLAIAHIYEACRLVAITEYIYFLYLLNIQEDLQREIQNYLQSQRRQQAHRQQQAAHQMTLKYNFLRQELQYTDDELDLLLRLSTEE